MNPAVLLMAYGSPDSLDQMGDYLKNVLKGRPVSDSVVKEFQDRYRMFGGRSPLLEISKRQAQGLQDLLGIPVAVGMRYWHPFIAEVVKNLGDPIIGVPLAPQHSLHSSAGYLQAFRDATSARTISVDHWHRQPHFLDAWADRIREGMAKHGPEVVLFTAHSVPEDEQDPYPRHLKETVDGILERISDIRWDFAYQSASSAPLPWLGPDMDEKLQELRENGVRRVMAVPVSFICDHAEVLYDLDHLHRESARGLGMTFTRCESLNDHPLLIQALADAVREVL